ncbi:PAS domain S-box protein [Marinagarivorans cellulosilyticus]|uniref:Sensory/regulatory protein RpfC n=1 Tax=Marinagarivorans cellulosilyticus TaxID=2721545 RepID=A0AAN1WGH3_9GAMM|nr:PAS domain S-box protein [Marinagarivorans cellulosilyticus]BCD97176.1 hypothetical protein MARGE09_P1377 [Marinagarivorans cellulosilyticus]
MMLGLDVLIAVVIGALVGTLVAYVASTLVRRRAQKHSNLIALIARVQSRFLNNGDAKTAFYQLLEEMVAMTASDYGYIAEVRHDDYGQPYLRTRALWDTSWSPDTRELYRDQDLGGGMEFHDIQNILASVLVIGETVFINDVEAYSQKACDYEIRPMHTFVGLPVYVEQRLVAVVGLANRPTGYDLAQEQEVTPLLATVGQILDNCIISAQKRRVESQFETTKALVDGSNDAIVLSSNGVFIDCNPATQALFQCTKEQFLGKSLRDFSPEKQDDGSDSHTKALAYSRMVEGGEPQRFLWQYKKASGELFTAEVSLSSINDDGHKIFAAVLRDVTEQERYQRQIKEQKAQLELVLEGTSAGIWDWNLKTQEITFNERWANIIGYTLAELEPISLETWKHACHPDDFAASSSALHDCLSGKTDSYIFETRMRHKNGSWIWVLDTGKVVAKDEQGNPVRMVGTHIDIDLVKRSEERAAAANLQLKNFFNLSQDYMCVANVSGHFEKVNQKFVNELGYLESELLQQPFFNFIHPDDYDNTMDELLSLSDGHSSVGFRNRFRKHEGDYITLQWNLTPDPSNGKIYATAFDVTEKDKAEQELRMLSRIAKEVRTGVVVTDDQGRITWANEAFEGISGYCLDEFIGKKPKDFLHGVETDEKTIREMRAAIAEKRDFRVEVANYHKDGSIYWVDIDCSPMLGSGGELQGFMAIETDITEQKNNALELERQQMLLEQMSEIGNIGAWEVDLLTKEIYWSSFTRNIHQVDESFKPTLDKAINFYKEGDSRNKITSVVNKAIETGEAWALEVQLITAQGRELWVSTTGKAIFSNGRCVKLMGSFQDIDERKRHQITYQKSVLHSQALASLTLRDEVLHGDLVAAAPAILVSASDALQACRVSIWLFDDDCGQLECVSLYESEPKRFTSGAVLAKADYPEYFNYLFTHSILSAGDANTHPGSYEFSEGYLKPLGIVSMLDGVISGGGSFVGVVCVEHTQSRRDWSAAEETFVGTIATIVSSVVDREKRRKTEQVLITAIEEANAAAQAKSDFLASMSHEIRTPMNGVLGMLGLVLKTELNADQYRKINIAQNSAQSLLTIINDILDFSKIDAGKLEMELLAFDLIGLLAEVSETMAFRAEEQQLELILDVTGVAQPHVLGDPGRLRQIFMNLISNALKFTHQGEVVISAETTDNEDGRLCFVGHVTDTGIGISPEKQADLFDAFTQVDASNTRQYGGTGLGLSIVKKLCEAMDGEVWVESNLGQGSCFSFKIFLQKDTSPELALPKIDLNHRKVLVVDDNATNREIVAEQLAQWNIDVYLACGANEAVALCSAHIESGLFDIALLDMQMPGIDGATLGKTLKSDPRYRQMPLIMMTSQAQRGDAAEFAALGFAGYFPKPVSPQVLLNAIKVILEGSVLEYAAPLVTRHFLDNLEQPEIPLLSPTDWPLNARILLVEDHSINREVAINLLEDIGLTADVAVDGKEAISTLIQAPAAYPYQLVLMDCQMPVMDGFAATKAIRQGEAGDTNRNITIIAMTANALKGDKERCLDAGMNDYLPKPIDVEKLESTLKQWLLAVGNTPKATISDVNDKASVRDAPASNTFASNTFESTTSSSNTSSSNTSAGAPALNSQLLRPFSGPASHFSTQSCELGEDNVSDDARAVPLSNMEQKLEDLEAAIWDLAGALKRVRGRPERLLSLIQSYSEQSPEIISDLYQKIESNELAEAAALCHTLRGVAGNLGGTQLIAMAEHLEASCNQQDHDEAERLVGELLVSNNDFLTAIQGYRH